MSKSSLLLLCVVSVLAIVGLALSSSPSQSGALMVQPTYFNDMQAFPLEPQINCQYDDEFGTMQWTVKNTLDTPIILDHASIHDIAYTTYAVMIINGREVDPNLLCSSTTVPPGQEVDCARWFDPNKLKSDIYRTYHNYDWLSTYKGDPVLDVLRMRIIYKGSKYRTNKKFECTQV